MPSRDWQKRVEDIINAASEILNDTEGMTVDEFRTAEPLLLKGMRIRTSRKLGIWDAIAIIELSVSHYSQTCDRCHLTEKLAR